MEFSKLTYQVKCPERPSMRQAFSRNAFEHQLSQLFFESTKSNWKLPNVNLWPEFHKIQVHFIFHGWFCALFRVYGCISNALSLFCGFFQIACYLFMLFWILRKTRFCDFFGVFMDFYCFHIVFIVFIGLDEFGYVFNRYQWISLNFNQFLWIFVDFFMIFMIFIIFYRFGHFFMAFQHFHKFPTIFCPCLSNIKTSIYRTTNEKLMTFWTYQR